MLFNSLTFLLFFPAVTVVFWILPGKLRNYFLLVSSYYFYMNWEPIYALLILLSTIITWTTGLLMDRHQSRRKLFLTLCITVNIAILFVYKYAGFFNNVVHDLLSAVGIGFDVPQFTLLLPVGISFYTFQAVGYTIDVYRGTIKPERNFFTYALFVSFFPQLVAGPIERAKNLLPQFHAKHVFSGQRFIDGLQMMMWGYFMKLCIAENVGTYVDAVFNNLHMHNGTTVLLAAVFFTFQIFCDFGGYSLIAIGCARCLGFDLMQNFRQPYLATSIKDFWRRWHISLTSWMTDYIYIPLGGNRCSRLRHKGNIMATFLISGLWHGANYTFIVWGAYHGALQVCQSVTKEAKSKFPKLEALGKWRPLATVAGILFTFILVSIGWVFFRANTLTDAVDALYKIAFDPGPLYNGAGKPAIVLPILLIGALMLRETVVEIREKRRKAVKPSMVRGILVSSALLVTILLCASFEGGQFIYFQF